MKKAARKLTTVITMIAIANLTLFSACKKDDPVQSKTAKTNLVSLASINSDLLAINAKYAHNFKGGKTTAINGAQAAAAGADLVAAATTARTFWAWCVSGWGAFACAGLTVIAAAVTSYGTYKGCGGIAIDTSNKAHQKALIVADVDHYTIPNPYSNPYDSAGIKHNEMVKILCQKQTDLALNYTTLTYASTDLSQFQLQVISMDTPHLAYNMCNYVSNPTHMIDNNGNITLTNMINTYCNDDATVKTVVTDITSGLQGVSNLSDAMSLLNDYENYFLNTNTGLTDQEKYSVLTSLSVAKYSYTMWNDALTN